MDGHPHHGHASHYHHHGNEKHNTKKDAFWIRRQRQRMNFVAVCQALFIPWAFFCIVCGVTCFTCHYCYPWVYWAMVIVGTFTVLLLGMRAFRNLQGKLKEDVVSEPTWIVFIFISMLISLAVALLIGGQIYDSFMLRHRDYENLNDYNYVNVATSRGQQLMDGGRLKFVEGTTLDLRKAIGFKNLHTYCVVPLTMVDKNGVMNELTNYDFWAVGLDCCSGDNTDYRCGEFNNTKARGGLRLLEDGDRDFYRLAVQQAEGMYHVKADHPLFLYWTEDPMGEMKSWRQDAYKFYYIAMLVHFAFQLLCVSLAVAGFSKLGLY